MVPLERRLRTREIAVVSGQAFELSDGTENGFDDGSIGL
jgi:hypothetical protein